MNVFAGLKLNGKNPHKAPAKAVIIIIAINGELFKENIINSDIHEIIVMPDDNPSNPSIKLIALVITIIQITVKIIDNASLSIADSNKGTTSIILIPEITTAIAAKSCPESFANGFIVFTSSIKQVIPNIKTPTKNPNIFLPYCSVPNKLSLDESSIDNVITKYIKETTKPAITATPPSFGIGL